MPFVKTQGRRQGWLLGGADEVGDGGPVRPLPSAGELGTEDVACIGWMCTWLLIARNSTVAFGAAQARQPEVSQDARSGGTDGTASLGA